MKSNPENMKILLGLKKGSANYSLHTHNSLC